MNKGIILPLTALVAGGVAGYVARDLIGKEERSDMDNLMERVGEFCGDQHTCDDCPFLVKDADCCYFHCDVPNAWQREEIEKILKGGSK